MAVSASFVAIMGILSKLFPDRIATIMATCEAIFGVGFTFGTVGQRQSQVQFIFTYMARCHKKKLPKSNTSLYGTNLL